MKTLIITNIQKQLDGSQAMYEHFKAKNAHLPQAAFEEKLFQAFYQVGLLGPDNDCYGFFETAEEYGVKMPADALVGSIMVRVDYDPMFNYSPPDETPEFPSAETIVHHVAMALSEPNILCKFPDNADVDHIRVTTRVAPDKDITRSYWPHQLPDYIEDKSKLRY